MLVRTILAALPVLSSALTAQQSEHWNQFRGPGGRGIAATRTLPAEFGPKRNLAWRCAIGAGLSSPCVWGDRVFLTTHEGKKLETLCVKGGRVLWRRAITTDAIERHHRINGPASSTPTTDGTRVFAYFGSFGLVCYDFAGKELWRRTLPRERNLFGTAASPIVHGGKLILNRDNQKGSFVEAMRPDDGETIWRTDRGSFRSSWSTPCVWKNGDVEELLVYGVFQLTAYDLATGEVRWSVPGLADEPCITPVTGDGLVFVSSYNMRTNPEVIGLPKFATLLAELDKDADGKIDKAEAKPNKSILSRADADGEGDHPLSMFMRFLDADRDGKIDAEEWTKMHRWLGGFKHRNAVVAIRPGVRPGIRAGAGDGNGNGNGNGNGKGRTAKIAWQHGKGVPECPSPLYHDGRIYLVKNAGIATCLDAKTGAQKWQGRIGSRGPCYASPILGDGKIYTASARGVITVLATGDTLKVLARNDLKERIMATPAIVDGTLYVRTDKHLYAFQSPR